MKRYLIVLILTVWYGSIVLSTLGCAKYELKDIGNGYKAISVIQGDKHGMAHFTFEYSNYWKIEGPSYDLDGSYPSTFLYLIAPDKQVTIKSTPILKYPGSGAETGDSVTWTFKPGGIHIKIFDGSNRNATAKGDMEHFLQNDDILFIFDRSNITIAGIVAEEAKFFRESFGGNLTGTNTEGEFVWWVYFEQGGYIWCIEAQYEESIQDIVESDMTRIIQTFKILN